MNPHNRNYHRPHTKQGQRVMKTKKLAIWKFYLFFFLVSSLYGILREAAYFSSIEAFRQQIDFIEIENDQNQSGAKSQVIIGDNVSSSVHDTTTITNEHENGIEHDSDGEHTMEPSPTTGNDPLSTSGDSEGSDKIKSEEFSVNIPQIHSIPKQKISEQKNELIQAKLVTNRVFSLESEDSTMEINHLKSSQRDGEPKSRAPSWRLSQLHVLPTPPEIIASFSAAATEHVRQEERKERNPKWKPKVTEKGETPEICEPQPMRYDQESPKLMKMNHDWLKEKNATNTTKGFNYFNANYSSLREGITFDQMLLPPTDNGDINSLPKWKFRSTPTLFNAAICKIRSSLDLKLQHFAHAAEEIYKCFDYWTEFASTTSLKSSTSDHSVVIRPVLMYNRASQGEYLMDSFKNNPFMEGIYEFLTTQIGMIVLPIEEYIDCHTNHHATGGSGKSNGADALCQEIYHPEQTVRTHNSHGENGYLFEHVYEWNFWMDRFLAMKELHGSAPSPAALTETSPKTLGKESTSTPIDDVCSRPPRIGILNRARTRSILNSEDLAKDLSNLVYIYDGVPEQSGSYKTENVLKLNQPVEVTYFESKTFLQQVDFFRKTEIVISPHGAQLTGLPFMQNAGTTGFIRQDENTKDAFDSCRQILELFPKNYAIPYYFGSLAVQSGLHHSYVYFDDGVKGDEEDNENGTQKSPDKDGKHEISPLKELQPWDRVTSSTSEGRYKARKAKFCPRSDDFISYVAELVLDWYRCHQC